MIRAGAPREVKHANPYFFVDNSILFLKEPARTREHFRAGSYGKMRCVSVEDETRNLNYPKLFNFKK